MHSTADQLRLLFRPSVSFVSRHDDWKRTPKETVFRNNDLWADWWWSVSPNPMFLSLYLSNKLFACACPTNKSPPHACCCTTTTTTTTHSSCPFVCCVSPKYMRKQQSAVQSVINPIPIQRHTAQHTHTLALYSVFKGISFVCPENLDFFVS